VAVSFNLFSNCSLPNGFHDYADYNNYVCFSTTTTTNATSTAQQPEEGEEHAGNATTVRDSIAVLLTGETISGGSFIHLYDSTPEVIVNRHVAAKIPCDENSNSTLIILTGSAPNLQPTELELFQNYHFYIGLLH
jgi:hypothetical protein